MDIISVQIQPYSVIKVAYDSTFARVDCGDAAA